MPKSNKKPKRVKRYFRKYYQKFLTSHFTSIQIIVFYYLIATLLAFILLSLPFFHKPHVHVSLLDMLFMAISTISVTGLTTVPLNEVFNERGIILLEVLFQIGGLGIMMVSTLFFLVSKRKITLRQRQLIMTDMNQPRLSGIVRLIRTTFLILLGLQLLFGIIFMIHFYLTNSVHSWKNAFFYGFYQAISAVTNSGFDITGNSLLPYQQDYFFLTAIMFLIFIGGIGFPVILEIKEWLFYSRKKNKLPFRFSLFSKLALLSFIILFIGGTVLIYLLENHHLFRNFTFSKKVMTSMFYSMTTRNAGLQLNDLNQFQPATLLLFSFLMFIGCSPSSVGGGVRTTTVIILSLYLVAFIRGKDQVSIFKRRIREDDIRKSLVVFILSLFLCFFSLMILAITERHSLLSLIVEVASAFGTTGLSLGITHDLSFVGKIVIAALMFIGRIGMLYTLMLLVPKEQKDSGYHYPSEQIIIG